MIMTKFRRNQKGFTLLEIMLVVLIIGIIALLALPRLLVTRKVAQENTCQGNGSALRTHLEAYKWNMGGYPIVADWPDFLTNTVYWPEGDPAPSDCPASGAYSYTVGAGGSATTIDGIDLITEYNLSCPNAHF